MSCPYYQSSVCLSCSKMPQSYDQQVEDKITHLHTLFQDIEVRTWCDPVTSSPWHFRNKAKMVALGAAHQPKLGVISPQGEEISLCDCPLYSQQMQALLKGIESWIQKAGLPPYKIAKKKGELKFVLVTESQANGEFMVRFVLNSHQAIERIERALPLLLADFPLVSVVSVNIQPVHMARLEGDEEIFLTEKTHLDEMFNHVPLSIRPKSFFQTNPKVAEQLYRTAQHWIEALNPSEMWDLFCGVGGFALHCASKTLPVTGIEIEPEAIACAQRSAQKMGLENLTFAALDSTGFSLQESQAPEVVLVNPPRRGLGKTLCEQLNHFSPKSVIYSSCNPDTLIKDLAFFTQYQVDKVQLFDMFPHSSHYEVLVQLTRK